MPRKTTAPVGIELYKGKTPKWRIGKELGNGACASVHVLEEIDGTPTEWAIKVAPIPTKKTKKANSMEEVNDRLLYYEHVMYQNQFQDIQGIFVPRLPPYRGPQTSGEAEGYRFLVMEQMACPLFDVIPQLLKSKGTAKTISFGPIAVQLLKCVQAIQERKHVVVDIKPENFMLSCDVGKGSTAAQKLASRVRLLDLALVQPWTSIGSHRSNDGTSSLAGTPLYASLNAHQGETPSRRDDLESLGYVIAELIMKLASGNASMELPWNEGQSDKEIGDIKSAVIDDVNSDFYSLLGGTAVVKVFKKYLDTVRAYTYKKTPDYNELERILSQLKVPVPKAPTPRKKNKRSSSKIQQASTSPPQLSGKKRVTRSSTRSASPEDRSPAKMARDNSHMEVEAIDSSFEDEIEDGASANDSEESFVSAMDWEEDEGNKPKEDVKPKALGSKQPTRGKGRKPPVERSSNIQEKKVTQKDRWGVQIVVVEGPHKGESYVLERGISEGFNVGKKPTGLSGGNIVLRKDTDLKATHARIELVDSKKMKAALVIDKSKGGTLVNRNKVKKGRAFVHDQITIGNTVLMIKPL